MHESACACGLPLRRRATLGSLCTGLMSNSTSVCLPHSGLAWLICKIKALGWNVCVNLCDTNGKWRFSLHAHHLTCYHCLQFYMNNHMNKWPSQGWSGHVIACLNTYVNIIFQFQFLINLQCRHISKDFPFFLSLKNLSVPEVYQSGKNPCRTN